MAEDVEMRVGDWRRVTKDLDQTASSLGRKPQDAETPFARVYRKALALQELARLLREIEAALKEGRASRVLGLVAQAQAITPDRSVYLIEWETDVLLEARDELVGQLDDALRGQARAILADRVHVVERLEAEYLTPASQEAERSDRETELRIIRLVIDALVKAAEAEQQMAAEDRGRAMEIWRAIVAAAGDDRWASLARLARERLQALQAQASTSWWLVAFAVGVGLAIGLPLGWLGSLMFTRLLAILSRVL